MNNVDFHTLDPRPRVVLGSSVELTGSRCTACSYPSTDVLSRCPECSQPMTPCTFGARGRVFASTVLRVPVPGREPPYGLAYVDMIPDEGSGPRILAHSDPTAGALPPGSIVELIGLTTEGDPLVRGCEVDG